MPAILRGLISLFQKMFVQHRTTKVLIYPFQIQVLPLIRCSVLRIPSTAVQCLKNREHLRSSVMPCTMPEVWNLPFIKSLNTSTCVTSVILGDFFGKLQLLLQDNNHNFHCSLSPSAVCSHTSIMHFGTQHQKMTLPSGFNDQI